MSPPRMVDLEASKRRAMMQVSLIRLRRAPGLASSSRASSLLRKSGTLRSPLRRLPSEPSSPLPDLRNRPALPGSVRPPGPHCPWRPPGRRWRRPRPVSWRRRPADRSPPVRRVCRAPPIAPRRAARQCCRAASGAGLVSAVASVPGGVPASRTGETRCVSLQSALGAED